MISLAEENGVDILSFLTQNQIPLSTRENIKIHDLGNHRPKPQELDLEILREQINTIKSKMGRTKIQIRFSPSGIPIKNIVDQYDGNISLDQYKCFSSWSKLVITAHGDIFPCVPIKLGNLRNLPLKKIWNSEKARSFSKHIKTKGLFPSCIGCCMLESSISNTTSGSI